MSSERDGAPPEPATDGESAPPAVRPPTVIPAPERVADAALLLDYAIDQGREIDDDIVTTIRWYQRAAGDGSAPAGPPLDFDEAYRDLARLLSPITAQTLRDTYQATKQPPGDWLARALSLIGPQRVFGRSHSIALTWSRRLWTITVLIVLLIFFFEFLGELLAKYFPPDYSEEGEDWRILTWEIINQFGLKTLPFLYGGLGACAYLLKSAHSYFHERTFDRYRVPEYFSRLLLGVIGGGTIMLFVEQVFADGEAINISSAALAFIVGYNTDYLFDAIKRVADAIMPRVGLESVRRAQPPAVRLKAVSAEELAKLLQETKDPDARRAIEALIKRVMAQAEA